jgi:Na+-exporting ATPase
MAQFTEKDVQATEQENQPLIKPAHALSHKDVICQLHSSIEGLSESDIQPRIAKYDRNELGTGEGVQPFKIFLRQVANAMTLVGPKHLF